MYTMASVPQRWCFGVGAVLLVLATCVLECSAQAQPTISGNGLFIVGQTKTMACYISTTEAASNFPLTWSRGGSTLTASDEQTLTVASSVNYNTFYKLTVAASDNQAVFTCTSTLPSGTTSATWTIYVYKGPDTPIISGPSAVVSGVNNTWTCIVDGASGTSPSVYWQFGNGTRLPQSTFTNVAQVYTDSNQLEIHKETSTLTMTATTGAPSFTLVCKGYHYDTNAEVASELPVTVTYPPEVTGGNVNYTVTAGTTATLVCDVRASPSATTVFWNKDGALIDRTSGRYSGGTVASPSLVISAVVKGDTGYYTCGGTNGIGSTTGDRIYLLVRYPPIITYSQNPVGGVLGSDVTLSCNIDSVPAYTTVLWYRVNNATGALTSISSTSNPSKYSGGTASTSPALTIKSLAADDAGLYRCKADNDVSRGEGANLLVQVNSVGASTEDTSLSTATLALIIIICLIILIVLILVIVYCCAVKKCFKKDNDVGPTQTTQPPAAVPAQRVAKDAEPKLNGYYSMHMPLPVNTTSNGRISMDEDKTVAPAPAPAPAHTALPYRGSGVSISVPGGGTPRPHHLPPLGQDGVPEEIEPAREEKTKEKKKKRRRRRHDGEDGSPRRNTPRHDPGV